MWRSPNSKNTIAVHSRIILSEEKCPGTRREAGTQDLKISFGVKNEPGCIFSRLSEGRRNDDEYGAVPALRAHQGCSVSRKKE